MLSFQKKLRNIYSKDDLLKMVKSENFERTTLSFYRYCDIKDAQNLRDELYISLNKIKVLGRIYLAKEGINAQISVPKNFHQNFIDILNTYLFLKDMKINYAIEQKLSFLKLKIKVRNKLVADGLNDGEIDFSNVGEHIDARAFNNMTQMENTLVVDMRNHYEHEIGHFKNAILPDVDTFKDALKEVKKILTPHKDKNIILYCTGGIRCEKASAYMKNFGFNNIYQIHGGIINYVNQVKKEGLENKFIGKNFVFDERLGENITEDIISKCHQCMKPCNTHINCKNDACHLLFIQCEECKEKFKGCCSIKCRETIELPIDVQKELRRGKDKKHSENFHKSKIRPKLTELI